MFTSLRAYPWSDVFELRHLPRDMTARFAVLAETLRSRLWVFPAAGALLAAASAWILVAIDREIADDATGFFLFGGGAESARSILSTIAAAMLTFTGLVFSVTMLVLQLASSQLSPRVARTFLRDRHNQVVLAIFVATFVYALLVLREVRSPPEAFVPALAVWWAFVLLLASVAAFIAYIDHMAHAMRVESVIAEVGDETREAIRRCYPDPYGAAARVDLPLPEVSAIVTAPDRPTIVQAVDEDRLRAVAEAAGVALELVARVGDSIPANAPLARVHGPGIVDPDEVRSSIALGGERTMEEDPAFGFRQLVDIAIRALSPGINDPTTAVAVLARLHDLLHELAGRAIPGPHRVGADGGLRLVVPRMDWDAYVDLACTEIREYGRESSQVRRALADVLDRLATVVPPERLAAVRRQRATLDDSGSAEGATAR